MNIKEIKELIELIDGSNLTEFNYENSGEKLILKKEQNVIVSEQFQKPPAHNEQIVTIKNVTDSENNPKNEGIDKDLKEILSPIVGTFYSAPSPESKPFVKIGDKIKKGDTLCIVEAMKLMNEISAEYDCEIVKIYVKNGDMVEYGKPLFAVKAF